MLSDSNGPNHACRPILKYQMCDEHRDIPFSADESENGLPWICLWSTLHSENLANSKSHHLAPEEISLQPPIVLSWVTLSGSSWNHSHRQFSQGRTQWRSALSDGLLLYQASYLPKVCGYPLLCHSHRIITGLTSSETQHSHTKKLWWNGNIVLACRAVQGHKYCWKEKKKKKTVPSVMKYKWKSWK